MHIFLTGMKNVGKTMLIRQFLSMSGFSADGFMTYWEKSGKQRRLYLSPYNENTQYAEKYLLAIGTADELIKHKNTMRVFDNNGAKILNNSGKHDVIVMDELGTLESGARHFKQAVMECLKGDVPVLGVVKPISTEFLDEVRSHPLVTVREVTKENRSEVLSWLQTLFTNRG